MALLKSGDCEIEGKAEELGDVICSKKTEICLTVGNKTEQTNEGKG